MDIVIYLISKWAFLAGAAIGFGILFNVPFRTLLMIGIMAILGGSLKFLNLKLGGGIVIGSFYGALLIGFLSIPAAHWRHSPPFVFAIPSVIPMVPGTFAYRMMLGCVRLTNNLSGPDFLKLWTDTVDNGLKTFWILLALALGVSAPMLLFRAQSAKNLRLDKSVRHLSEFWKTNNKHDIE